GKVSQILRNFISNAIKFTEKGEVRVTASLNEDGRTLRLAVADTGVGIRKEDQGEIFEEFTQVPNKLQGRVKGTGLGLPLCRRLAREARSGTLVSTTQPDRLERANATLTSSPATLVARKLPSLPRIWSRNVDGPRCPTKSACRSLRAKNMPA
ncbi:hypothetical protein B4Q13_18590, partial [Lacticaseibacillus rhamnosus]